MSDSVEKAEFEMAMFVNMTARACHEANRKYCQSIGDNSQVPWEEASEAVRQSAFSGVIHRLENPESTPEDSHKNWMRDKVKAGWIYGPEKSEVHRMHPCLVPYDKLPEEQKVKEEIFIAVVEIMIATHLAVEKRIQDDNLEVDWNA